MRIALLARAAQVGVHFVEAGEVADEALVSAARRLASHREIASLKQPLIPDDGRAHGPVLVRARADEQRFLMPESETHSLIV